MKLYVAIIQSEIYFVQNAKRPNFQDRSHMSNMWHLSIAMLLLLWQEKAMGVLLKLKSNCQFVCKLFLKQMATCNFIYMYIYENLVVAVHSLEFKN